MPVVSVDLMELSGVTPGVDNLKDAVVWFYPYQPYGSPLVTTDKLVVDTVDGVGSTFLPQTPAGNAMWVEIRRVRLPEAARKFLVSIPASDCNLFDLEHLDPADLSPLTPPSPVWVAQLAAEVQAREDADAALSTDLFNSLATEESDRTTADTTNATNLTNHLNDAADAHDASAISFVPGGTIAATDVQAAILEVASEAGSGNVPNTRTVNGHPLSADVTVTKSDVSLGNVDNTSDATKLAAAQALVDSVTTSDIIATSTAGALTRGKWTRVDATAGSKAMTLANATAARQVTIVEKSDSSANTVTIGLGLRGSAGSLTLSDQFETFVLVADDDLNWYVETNHRTRSSILAQILATSPSKVMGIYNLTDYGIVDTTGATDSNTAWNAAVTALYAGGGGTLQLPLGTILVTTQTTLPSANPSATGMLRQPPMLIKGVGSHAAGQTSKGSGGSRLNLTYQGAGSPVDPNDAKIRTFGSGLVQFRDVVVMDTTATNSSTPFVYTTGTTIKTDASVAVIGAGTGGLNCAQDFLVAGGTLKWSTAPVYPATPNYGSLDAPFQGYGTTLVGTYFNYIRRAVYGRSYANQIVFSNCFIDKNCGSNLAGGAALEWDASLDTSGGHPGDPCAANVVTNNYIEILNYVYGVKFKRGSTNWVAFNGFEDAGAGFIAAVRMEGDATYPSNASSVVFNQVTNSIQLSEDAISSGKNSVLSTYLAQGNILHQPLTLLTDMIIKNGTFNIKDTTGATAFVLESSGAGYNVRAKGPILMDGKASTPGSTTLTIGVAGTTADAAIVLAAPSGQLNQIQMKRAGTNSWLFYDANSTSWFFRDSVNGKMHLTFVPGAGAGNGSTDVNSALTVAGKATLALSKTTAASLNIPHGVAPTTPADGDIWTTTAGMFVRVNGVTKTVTLT